MKITTVWNAIPPQLAKENKKFIFAEIHKNARSREYEEAMQWLEEAGLTLHNFRISAPKVPLEGYMESRAFKIFLLDVGLLGAMSYLPPKAVLDGHAL